MNAIKITATNETSGVDAEYDYLDNLLVEQSVIKSKNKLQTFWFDITSFYGR